MKNSILIILTIFSINAFAVIIPSTKEEYCSRFSKDTPSASEIIQDMTSEQVNLMGFKNDGGLFNGGVCWWHSRFQRNILYLSLFRPDLNKPKTRTDMQALIHQIRLGTSVVSIPGYHNFAEFSLENQKLIQNELNDWQLYDGVVLGGWMDGLKGETKIPANELQAMMKEDFDYVAVKKKIAYQKLQIKGITSHAWLIVGMKKSESGFDIGYLDSNSPRMSLNYTYKNGDTSFNVKGYGDFVPYLEFKREEERLVDSGKVYCGLKSRSFSNVAAMKNYELDLKEAKSFPAKNTRN